MAAFDVDRWLCRGSGVTSGQCECVQIIDGGHGCLSAELSSSNPNYIGLVPVPG